MAVRAKRRPARSPSGLPEDHLEEVPRSILDHNPTTKEEAHVLTSKNERASENPLEN